MVEKSACRSFGLGAWQAQRPSSGRTTRLSAAARAFIGQTWTRILAPSACSPAGQPSQLSSRHNYRRYLPARIAVNFLEQLVAEWYEYQGYFIRRNVRVGKLAAGGYECELDVVAFHPQTKH